MFFSPKGDVFATMKAVFWNKTVVGFGLCKSLLLGTRPEGHDERPQATDFMSGGFSGFCFNYFACKQFTTVTALILMRRDALNVRKASLSKSQ